MRKIEFRGSLAFAALLLAANLDAATYAITDLGTFGGSRSGAHGINASGQIAGFATTNGNAASHPFLATATAKTDLGTFGGTLNQAHAVNSAGVVVGTNSLPGDATFRAFVALGSTLVDLGTLGGSGSEARAINPAGQIAGHSQLTGDTATHAYRYQNGLMADLGTLGGTDSFASGINAAGRIAGVSQIPGGAYRAFFHNGTTMVSLGTLGTGDTSDARALNDHDQIVGRSNLVAAGPSHPFLYEGGQLEDLGTLGGSDGTAHGINNSRQIVGESLITGDGATHAFLYEGAQMTDLNTLLPENSGWVLTTARAINDFGRIVGQGIIGGQLHAYVLTPINPHPPSDPPPRIYINGAKKILTDRPRIRVEGSTGGTVTKVEYRIGPKRGYRPISWQSGWHFMAKLERGRNVIRVVATGPSGHKSRPAKLTVIRR